MRTLGQIIEEVKDGGRPAYDDLRFAVIAICALGTFDGLALRKLAEAKREGQKPILTRDPEWQHKEHWQRWHTALKLPPKDYVGPSHDPDTDECKRWRALSKKLLAKVEAEAAAAEGRVS